MIENTNYTRCPTCQRRVETTSSLAYRCFHCSGLFIPVISACSCKKGTARRDEAIGCVECCDRYFYAVLGLNEGASGRDVQRARESTFAELDSRCEEIRDGKRIVNQESYSAALKLWHESSNILVNTRSRATYDKGIHDLKQRIEDFAQWGYLWGIFFVIAAVVSLGSGPGRFIGATFAPDYAEHIVGYRLTEDCVGERCREVEVPNYEFTSTSTPWRWLLNEGPGPPLLVLPPLVLLIISGLGVLFFDKPAAKVVYWARIHALPDTPIRMAISAFVIGLPLVFILFAAITSLPT